MLAILIVPMIFFAILTTTLNIVYIKTNVVGFSMLPTLNETVNNPEEEGDVIYIPEYQNTVKISGNVLYPNTVTYKDKMSVKEYIKMAGGYGFEAKKNRAFVVYINGIVAKARKNSHKVIEPGCEIIIPQKRQREGKLQEILSVATTSASIATMVASITNLVRN